MSEDMMDNVSKLIIAAQKVLDDDKRGHDVWCGPHENLLTLIETIMRERSK
jgi:hypothetical protein